MLVVLTQTIFWFALATWFGGVLFIAIAAPVIFRTVREGNPVLPMVLSVNMEGQHGTLLAGTIVANLLSLFTKIGLICAGVLLLVIVGQWFTVNLGDANIRLFMVLQTICLGGATLLSLYAWRSVFPKILRYRQEYLDHADEPEVANPAKDKFDRLHHESVTVLSIVLFLLMGMVLFGGAFSAERMNRPVTTTISAAPE